MIFLLIFSIIIEDFYVSIDLFLFFGRRPPMYPEHETIRDDKLTQLYFSAVKATNDLLPAHWHQHLEILYLARGKMTAYINETSYHLLSGDMLVVNPRDIHYTHVHGDCLYYLLQIPFTHLERISPDWKLIHFEEYLPSATSGGLKDVFRRLIVIDEEKQKGYTLLFLIQLYELLYLLYTEHATMVSVQNKNRTERDFSRIEQSMRYVKENYSRSFSLNDIASELSLSPEYFCRLFKKYTGQTFFTYVNQVRFLHFYEALLSSDESITFLLDKCGITNYKSFLQEFKKAYGTTPHKIGRAHV